MPDDKRPRIVNVTRKPSKCPDCSSKGIDIVYGTEKYDRKRFFAQISKKCHYGW